MSNLVNLDQGFLGMIQCLTCLADAPKRANSLNCGVAVVAEDNGHGEQAAKAWHTSSSGSASDVTRNGVAADSVCGQYCILV